MLKDDLFPRAPGSRNLFQAPHSGGIRTSEANEEAIQIGIVRLGHVAKVKLYPFLFIKNSRFNYFFFLKSSFAAKIGPLIYTAQVTVQVDIVFGVNKNSMDLGIT